MQTKEGGTLQNFEITLDCLRPAIGKANYRFSPPGMDIVPEGSPAYAVNREGLYCQAVINLMLRRVGKRVPKFGNPDYDGGTRANQIYFAVILGDGSSLDPYILQSISGPGLTDNVRLGQSHQGWYHEYAVSPQNWINYEGDEF